jgi:hypothetical protein
MRWASSAVGPDRLNQGPSMTPRMSVSSPTQPDRVRSSRSFSAVSRVYWRTAAVRASAISGGPQGLTRNRKTCPWFTAAWAVARSALPVSMMRTLSGASAWARLSNSTPFIPGISMSATTTA